MKNLKNALGMSVLFILILFFASCGPSSSPGGHVDPNPAPAKISNVLVTPTQNIVLTGMPAQNNVNISVTADGFPKPSISINGISGSSFTTPNLFNSTSYNVSASNSVGTDSKKVDITVTVHPTFSQIVGLDSSLWDFTSFKIQNLRDPAMTTPVEVITPCQKGYVFTFRKDLTSKVDRGQCGGGVTDGATFKFDISA